MNICGIDYSTKAIDLVTIPYDDTPQYAEDLNGGLHRFAPQAPEWHNFPLEGDGAFDRARDVHNALHGPSSAFWDDILAVGIEHPGGHYGTQAMIRIQGAILSCIPARMLVQPLSPARWRKLVGLPGNASKTDIAGTSGALLMHLRPLEHYDAAPTVTSLATGEAWPQDAHDAHLIAHATRTLIDTHVTA